MGLLSGFLKQYGKNALADASRNMTDAIVKFDPEGASEAEIAAMEEQFDQVNREFSKAKTEWKKEQAEADEIVELRDKRIAAAEVLQGKADGGDSNAEAGLLQLLDALEDMQDDIEREVEEAADAKEVMDELEETVNMFATKLKTARSDMKKAAQKMKKASQQSKRAEEKAERAAMLAGLKQDTNKLGSALASMNRQAEEEQAKADAATRKANLLGKSKVEENDAVAEAMAAVSGEAPKPTSAKDRLAALRNK